MIKIVSVSTIVLFCALVSAQTTEKYNSEYENFYRAEELFEKEQYGAARIEFRNFINGFDNPNDPKLIKALYYEGLAALELFNNDAVTLLEGFLRAYPESIYKQTIYFRLGKYFFQKKDFPQSLAWFNKLQGVDVDPDNRSEFFFKKGYANFQETKYNEARSAFYEVKEDSSQYGPPSLYYFSHIAYMEKTYQTALDGFLRLQQNESFKRVVPYYIAQIYYLQGKYKEVTEYAPTIMDTSNVLNADDMNHLIGDAYYRTGKFDEAVPYLEKYKEKRKISRLDEYQLGYAYFKTGMYDKAIKSLDRVTLEKDSLSQIAFYQIGECYLQLKNLLAARGAFEAASEINKDLLLQEDALYNYAVLSYKIDINPFDEAVVALETFLNTFPNSNRISEINQYLVNVYISTNNYKKALHSLDKIANKDSKLKVAYQLVAFNQGVEFFQRSEHKTAIQSFDLVSRFPIDATILGKAKFWSADAWFRLNEMDKCIKTYKEFLAMSATLLPEMKADAYYNLGYAYLKKEDVSQSIDAFRMYCQSGTKNKQKLTDAYMRAADGYYMTKQDENAIKHYKEVLALQSGYEDQASFYLAKSYGFMGNEDKKITHLLDIINNYKDSKFILTSIYEVALSYKISKADYDKALRYFQQVVADYPTSDLVLSSKIEIADIYYRKWDYAKAELAYKEILDQNSEDREICETVVRGLVDVYAALKQPEKASQLASEYACANISADEQETLFFNPALEAYKDSLYQGSIPQFEKYLERFPEGKYVVDALYYMSTARIKTFDKEKGVEGYQRLLEKENNQYTERVAVIVAEHLYNNGSYEQAIPYYMKIKNLSSKPASLFTANLGLMRCNFLIEEWASTALSAKEILASNQLNNTLQLEAEYAHGMATYQLQNFDDAVPSLEWVVKNTTTVMAAESKYTLAEIAYKKSDYKKSEATIKELLKMKPSYNYWVAKSLLLQARIHMAKNDFNQAEQNVKSIIDHYPDQEDGILAEAGELANELSQLKQNNKETEEKEPEQTEIEVKEGN
jgi:tetratricopeptide (TPR) repeat protein